jgi:hypothetical protein
LDQREEDAVAPEGQEVEMQEIEPKCESNYVTLSLIK